jgi:hypothetical protein
MKWLQRIFAKPSDIRNVSTQVSWQKTCYLAAKVGHANSLWLSPEIIIPDGLLTFDEALTPMSVTNISEALKRYRHSQSNNEPIFPQLAALVYDVTENATAMHHYFPILKTLGEGSRNEFFSLIQKILRNSRFHLEYWDVNQNVTAKIPSSMKAIVAGHIAETFFYRQDILERFLASDRFINIYLNTSTYWSAGGVAGGCYDLRTESIKLVAHRLYEGFYQPSPGGAPFLHEFGHMLDSFDASTGKMRHGKGFLPGMCVEDGELFTPQAREQFIVGKNIELDRYEMQRTQNRVDEIPIGHPYVFQNDGEFIAGYLEMFFRNPHYFHRLNPILYDGFSTLLRQDTRLVWEHDFSFYVESNRNVYLNRSTKLPVPGLTRFTL